MKNISEIKKEDLGEVSLFTGCLGDYHGDGFADCILAFPTDHQAISSRLSVDRNVSSIVSSIRVARSTVAENGSLWFWVKDSYVGGGLVMMPNKVVIGATCDGKWVVRNEIAWECHVADPVPENRLKRSYEKLFHLATGTTYFYDRTVGLGKPKKAIWKNGIPLSRTGVVGKKYYNHIAKSTELTDEEKANAKVALATTIEQLNVGEISDYRMAIRGIHKVSRARQNIVSEKGFSIVKTKTHSFPVSDLWRDARFLTNKGMPKELISTMVKLSCKPDGVVLDLFPSEVTAIAVVGTGRKYVAVSTDEALLGRIGNTLSIYSKGNLFSDDFKSWKTEITNHNWGLKVEVDNANEANKEAHPVQEAQEAVHNA